MVDRFLLVPYLGLLLSIRGAQRIKLESIGVRIQRSCWCHNSQQTAKHNYSIKSGLTYLKRLES